MPTWTRKKDSYHLRSFYLAQFRTNDRRRPLGLIRNPTETPRGPPCSFSDSVLRVLVNLVRLERRTFSPWKHFGMRFNNAEPQPYASVAVSVSGFGSASLDPDDTSTGMEDMMFNGSTAISSDEMCSKDASSMPVDDPPITTPYETPPPKLDLCSLSCCPVEEHMNAIAYALHARCNFNIHPALTLSLWSPSHLYLGAVGYYSEHTGEFVTLLNAHRATELSNGSRLPPIWASDGQFKVVFFKYHHHSYQLDVELIPGRPAAFTFARSATYGYMDDFCAAKEWFQAFADVIMAEHGARHCIRKNDLCLVTGILNAEDYTLFISHSHPPAHLSFAVDPKRICGKPWGAFDVVCAVGAPGLEGAFDQLRVAGKTSEVRFVDERDADPLGGDTLMLARLGFRAGVEEPVLL
ncbi:hypothetical protein F5I97DRAFT_1842609 [Phlebopus sp. FC_14]|nr:hypothetical protein F5I97DRAFT_1842609 [Phlebopus sp. FC_14]